MWLGDFNFPYCFLEWLLTWILRFHKLSFFWIDFDNLLAISLPILCLGSTYPSVSPHSCSHSTVNSCPQKEQDLMSKMWKVILLLSLAECFELSLCIAKWCSSVHPLPPIFLLAGQQSISLLCVSMNESLREESLPLEKRLKSSCVICSGASAPSSPLPPPIISDTSFLCAQDELHT